MNKFLYYRLLDVLRCRKFVNAVKPNVRCEMWDVKIKIWGTNKITRMSWVGWLRFSFIPSSPGLKTIPWNLSRLNILPQKAKIIQSANEKKIPQFVSKSIAFGCISNACFNLQDLIWKIVYHYLNGQTKYKKSR